MYFDFPFRIDQNGRSSTTNEEQHIKNLIEQILFTSPGERVNRPNFGCGLKQIIFEPNSDILTVSIDTMIQSSLNSFLDHLIIVESVNVKNENSILEVTVKYTIRKNQRIMVETFRRGV
jgi:phage baseplate assembly protein W